MNDSSLIDSYGGVQLAYYMICHRKLWLFSHNLRFEHEHENVRIGKFLHEDRYSREDKEVQFGGIAIDFIQSGDGLVLHEVKKTRMLEESHVFQMKYYLYCVSNAGVKCRGEINYPLLNKKKQVALCDVDRSAIELALSDIARIVTGALPAPSRRKICKKCAYEDFCFSGMIE